MFKGYRGETERERDREREDSERDSFQAGVILRNFLVIRKFHLPCIMVGGNGNRKGGQNQNLMEGLTWVSLKMAWKLDSSNYDLKGM